MITRNDVTIAVITFNSGAYIVDCMESILRNGAGEVLIIDNRSADDTVALVRERYPRARLIAGDRNIGHSAACNLAFREAKTPWVLLLDHDTVVADGWLDNLIVAINALPEGAVTAASSRVVFDDRRETIESDGGRLHFLGNMMLDHFDEPLERHRDAGTRPVTCLGTTSLLIHRERALAAGGFDEDMFIYYNDFDFTLRLTLLGYRCFLVPSSIVYHRHGTKGVAYRGSGAYPAVRAYYVLLHRQMLIFLNYPAKVLFFALPCLAAYELILFGGCTLRGLLGAYLKALGSFTRRIPSLVRKRMALQRRITVRSISLWEGGQLHVLPGTVGSGWKERVFLFLTGLMSGYWKAVSRGVEP